MCPTKPTSGRCLLQHLVRRGPPTTLRRTSPRGQPPALIPVGDKAMEDASRHPRVAAELTALVPRHREAVFDPVGHVVDAFQTPSESALHAVPGERPPLQQVSHLAVVVAKDRELNRPHSSFRGRSIQPGLINRNCHTPYLRLTVRPPPPNALLSSRAAN